MLPVNVHQSQIIKEQKSDIIYLTEAQNSHYDLVLPKHELNFDQVSSSNYSFEGNKENRVTH